MKVLIIRRLANFGEERLPYVKELARLQHVSAYATLVLDGRFKLLSYAGRLHLQAGDVLITRHLIAAPIRWLAATSHW